MFPVKGLRFFTVYGPLGHPDMAYFGFTDKYFAGESIKIFNNGDCENDLYRDVIYINDIIMGVERVLSHQPERDEDGDAHRVFMKRKTDLKKLPYHVLLDFTVIYRACFMIE